MSNHFKRQAKQLTPSFLLKTRKLYRSTKQIRDAALDARQSTDPAHWLKITKATPYLRSQQIESEIVPFLNTVQAANVRTCLEIGTAKGGTLFMLMQACSPEATIISIDLQNPFDKRFRLRFGKQSAQTIHLIAGNSQANTSFNQVRNLLNGSALDLLFIDGDHSYTGVRRDYELYAPLVKQGGIIAFHDIMPDHGTLYGQKTSSKAGEVYKLWQEIHPQYKCVEFVDAAGQDGFGIGMIIK
jgi:predicted O-methyltransferase YrrM